MLDLFRFTCKLMGCQGRVLTIRQILFLVNTLQKIALSWHFVSQCTLTDFDRAMKYKCSHFISKLFWIGCDIKSYQFLLVESVLLATLDCATSIFMSVILGAFLVSTFAICPWPWITHDKQQQKPCWGTSQWSMQVAFHCTLKWLRM